MARLEIRISNDMKELLEKLAQKKRVTVSDIVRDAIKYYIYYIILKEFKEHEEK